MSCLAVFEQQVLFNLIISELEKLLWTSVVSNFFFFLSNWFEITGVNKILESATNLGCLIGLGVFLLLDVLVATYASISLISSLIV